MDEFSDGYAIFNNQQGDVEWSKIDKPNNWNIQPYGYFRYDVRLNAWVQSREADDGIAFYTVIPKWVGLTENEIFKLYMNMECLDVEDHSGFERIAKAVEEELRKKNT